MTWPTWAKALVWILLTTPVVLGVAFFLVPTQAIGPVAIENQSATPLVVRVQGIRDNSGTTETFAAPQGTRVVIGRDGLFPHSLELLPADCGVPIASYSLDTGKEGGSVTIASDGSVVRDAGGVPWFGDDAAPAVCPAG